MSIPVLAQVYDETRRLAIAGSVVAPGDFRLKKLIPPLQQAGKKAPVFAKVAEAATGLIESNERTSAAALLELSTLVNAILYTQGETGCQGKLLPVKTTELGQPKTQASARVLKPLLEALTTTGSGRLETIRDALARGAFHDFRLIGPALAALDDNYSEIGELVAQRILPLYGRAILPELQATFDPQGRSGHARRLLLMHKLDPEASREAVRQALDQGSKEVRIAAIGCLGQSPDDLPFLLEQAKARAKDVRSAALKALGSSKEKDAVKILCDTIGGADFTLAIAPIRASRNPTVLKALLEAAHAQLDTILSGTEKNRKKLGTLNERMGTVLECLRGRDDKKTEQFLLTMFAQCEQLAAVKGEPSGTDLIERLVSIMVVGSKKTQSALVDAHASLPPESLGEALTAAVRSREPAEVFELFSPYLTAKVNEKKRREPGYLKREAVMAVLTHGRHAWYYDPYEDELDNAAPESFDLVKHLDPQWLDLAVKLGHPELIQALAVPGHAGSNTMLTTLFHKTLAKSKEAHELASILGTMIRVRHPEATDSMIALLSKLAKSRTRYGFYWVGHLIPRLPPAEAVPKLETLLPTLPEKMIDELLDHVAELKSASNE